MDIYKLPHLEGARPFAILGTWGRSVKAEARVFDGDQRVEKRSADFGTAAEVRLDSRSHAVCFP